MTKKGKKRRGSLTIPIAPVAGLVGPLWLGPGKAIMAGDLEGGLSGLCEMYTGWSPRSNNFAIERLNSGLTPLLVGFLIHWVAGKLGVNRALGRAKIPVIRI